jgi:hypothetical protein
MAVGIIVAAKPASQAISLSVTFFSLGFLGPNPVAKMFAWRGDNEHISCGRLGRSSGVSCRDRLGHCLGQLPVFVFTGKKLHYPTR